MEKTVFPAGSPVKAIFNKTEKLQAIHLANAFDTEALCGGTEGFFTRTLDKITCGKCFDVAQTLKAFKKEG